MLKKLVFLAALLCLLGLFRTNLKAEIQFQADFVSRYIWRGFDLNPYKKPVFQPSITYEFGNSGLSLDAWMSFSFANKELNETRLTLAYARRLSEQFTLKAGIIHYGWYFAPNLRFEDDTSHEVFASVGMPEIVLQPAITFFYDFTNGDGFYVLLKTRYSFDPVKFLKTSFSASLGYNGGQWLAEGSDPGFSDLNIGLSLAYAWKEFRIIPFVNYTILLLDAIGKENHIWFGISLIYELEK
ncbi:MAG: hypothetical protein JSV17_15470 [Candidatus Aminicenantes bacterium]|nr:MAG: hypothetical protein JSV17_15470 [Candidatus Aminicenantes bacterium]